jgi:hypothetical protein
MASPNLEAARIYRGKAFSELEKKIYDLSTLADLLEAEMERLDDCERPTVTFCVDEVCRRIREFKDRWLDEHNASCRIEQSGEAVLA